MVSLVIFILVCTAVSFGVSTSSVENSPHISNPNISCRGENFDLCYNAMGYYERSSFVLSVAYTGEGPFNVTWEHRRKHSVPPEVLEHQINILSLTSELTVHVDFDYPEKQQGEYIARVSNSNGSNASITYMKTFCAAQYPEISVETAFLNKSAGDYLSISSNVTAAEGTLIFVCFVDKYTYSFNLSEHLDYYCLQCSSLNGRQCRPLASVSSPQEHEFSITSQYLSNCVSQFVITIGKDHLSTSDNGVVVFMAFTGGRFLEKNVKLYIKAAKFENEYIIYLAVGVSILAFFCFTLLIVYYVRQRKRSSPTYVSITEPPSESTKLQAPFQIRINGVSTRSALGEISTMIGTENPEQDEDVPDFPGPQQHFIKI